MAESLTVLWSDPPWPASLRGYICTSKKMRNDQTLSRHGHISLNSINGTYADGCRSLKMSCHLCQLQSYHIRGQKGEEPNGLVLCDVMGLGEGETTGLTLHDTLAVIKGHAPERYKVRQGKPLDYVHRAWKLAGWHSVHPAHPTVQHTPCNIPVKDMFRNPIWNIKTEHSGTIGTQQNISKCVTHKNNKRRFWIACIKGYGKLGPDEK